MSEDLTLHRDINGFTLVELMVTLTVAAILMTIAIPSFQGIIRNSRVVTTTNNFVATLALARNEAIKQGIQITVSPVDNGSKKWDQGWEIFTDLNGNGVFDDNGNSTSCEDNEDCLIKVNSALPSGYSLTSYSNYENWLAYRPNGMSMGSSGNTDGSFILCNDLADKNTSRTISINKLGRHTLSKGSSQCP